MSEEKHAVNEVLLAELYEVLGEALTVIHDHKLEEHFPKRWLRYAEMLVSDEEASHTRPPDTI
jgi:hypothetical protein